jgi:outer membrane lipoprotein-sorting protein
MKGLALQTNQDRNMKVNIVTVFLLILISPTIHAQDIEALMKKVRLKLELVNDYKADGLLKTDVPFMKVPESRVSVFYKKPNKFKIKKEEGISIVPKGGITINLNSLFAGNEYTIVPGGTTTLQGRTLVIIKLLPIKEENDVVISTLYIDEKEALIYKANTTTKNSGTYEMQMSYGRFAKWGLPDKLLVSFNTKEYKLPKGVTFEYETEQKPEASSKTKEQKGTVEITYQNYSINIGIQDNVFSASN